MRILILSLFLFLHQYNVINGQIDSPKMDEMKTITDSLDGKCANNYCNVVSFGSKYYFNTLKNTRTTLSQNGFLLDQNAVEFQLRLYNLPKIFYYHQLGTLTNSNYVSVSGIGLKEDIRFDIVKSPNFIFAPYIEFGAGFYRMNLVNDINSNTITSVLKNQVQNQYLDNFVFSGDVGLDLGFGFKLEDHRCSIIFNGGYIVNYPNEWRLAGSLAFKEKINLASPYAGVTLRLDMNCCNGCSGLNTCP